MALADATRGPDATPIDRYLAAQADLRVVERFARADVAERTGQWSDLIPLSAPGSGEQYRFEVDLDSCTGCKACVTACHSLNGLDESESFRSIGLLLSAPPPSSTSTPVAITAAPAEQTVTTACHHCLDPGCLTGCPAEAYEKDPVTGIVKHLDDACIGCQYCTLTCPYDVPVYNDRLGIVRKCDLCADRLADGEAPACVQGCPTSAITVSTVATADTAAATNRPDATVIPGAAPSALTGPTTLYRGRLLDAAPTPATDPTPPTPQHSHLPLVAMLVLSQWSVGVLLATLAADIALDGATAEDQRLLGTGVAAALAAVSALASLAHLGQPLKAWRAVLGWSHSWLSREVVALSAYIGVATIAAALHLFDRSGPATVVAAAAATLGVVTVGCSVMIYVATGRRWWRLPVTAARFALTVALAAVTWTALMASLAEVGRLTPAAGALALLAVTAIEVRRRAALVAATNHNPDPDLQRSAALVGGPLASEARIRSGLLVAGAAALAVSAAVGDQGLWPRALALTAIALVAAAELVGRRLFFQACAPRTMPGAHR